jgi:hypothetical protein
MKTRLAFAFLAFFGPAAVFAQAVDRDRPQASTDAPWFDSEVAGQELPADEITCPDESPAAGPASLLPLPETHRTHQQLLTGLASYYSDFFDGRRTASGEIFHQARYSAAHRTLPFGTVIEVRSVATGSPSASTTGDRSREASHSTFPGPQLTLSASTWRRIGAWRSGLCRHPARRLLIRNSRRVRRPRRVPPSQVSCSRQSEVKTASFSRS